MPTLDFPNNPFPGQQYNAPNNVQYTWSTEGVWTAISDGQPSPNPPSVATPTIISPPNGSTGVGGSGGLTVSATSFSGVNNPGTHQSSDWQLSLDGPLLVSTNSISSVTQGPSSTTLSLAGGLADGFTNGDVVSNGLSEPDRAEGTITNITPTSVTVSPGSASWLPGQFLNRGSLAVDISASTISLTSLSLTAPPLTPNTEYNVRVRYRSSSSVLSEWSSWSVFTTGNLSGASINTPAIVTPPNGATNVGTYQGVTLTGSPYSPSGGAGAQTSSTWEVYKWNGAVTSAISNVTSVGSSQSNWSSMLAAVPGFLSGSSATNAFTSNLTLEAATSSGGVNSTITFTTTTPISVGNSLWIYVKGSPVGAGISINGGAFYAIGSSQYNVGSGLGSGTNIPNTSGTTEAGWFDLGSIMGLTFPFTLSSLVVRGNTSGSRGGRITSLKIDGAQLINTVPLTQVEITFSDSTSLSRMSVGNKVSECDNSGTLLDSYGTLAYIDIPANKVCLGYGQSFGTWTVGSRMVNPHASSSAPSGIPSLPEYTAVTGSPFSITSGSLTSLTVPRSSLTAGSQYWARVKYTTTNSIAATSPFSSWSSFTTTPRLNSDMDPGIAYSVDTPGLLTEYSLGVVTDIAGASSSLYFVHNGEVYSGSPGGGAVVLRPEFGVDIKKVIPTYDSGLVIYYNNGTLRSFLGGFTTDLQIPSGVIPTFVTSFPATRAVGAVLSNNTLWVFTTQPASKFGDLTVQPYSWTGVPFNLPGGDVLTQVCAYGGGYYDCNMVIMLGESGKIYSAGTSNSPLGVPAGTFSSPTQIGTQNDYVAIASLGANYGSYYGFSALSSSGRVDGAVSGSTNHGADLSFGTILTSGASSPIWANYSGGSIFLVLRDDGLYGWKATALANNMSTGAQFVPVKYNDSGVTPNPVTSVGTLPNKFQCADNKNYIVVPE